MGRLFRRENGKVRMKENGKARKESGKGLSESGKIRLRERIGRVG